MYGIGVPSIEQVRSYAENAITLVAQEALRQFSKFSNARPSDDTRLNEMALFSLPLPEEMLLEQGDLNARLCVTLSCFIEPNPSRRGHRRRYSYQSHGLRFVVRYQNEIERNQQE